MKRIIIILVAATTASTLLLRSPARAADTIKFETDPPQILDVPFRIFKTHNTWTHLLLDTRDGRVWQVQHTVDKNSYRGRLPINERPLASPAGKPGRFTLYPTQNIWNFLLLDTESGNIWQCQFSLERDGRFLSPILSPDQEFLIKSLSVLSKEEQQELADPKTPQSRRQELVDKVLKVSDKQPNSESPSAGRPLTPENSKVPGDGPDFLRPPGTVAP